MSAKLVYRVPIIGGSLGHGLKLAVEKKYLSAEDSGWSMMDHDDIPFFEGIAAAATDEETIKDAQRVIDFIRQHGAIKMRLRYYSR